jgi:hypothetical protein
MLKQSRTCNPLSNPKLHTRTHHGAEHFVIQVVHIGLGWLNQRCCLVRSFTHHAGPRACGSTRAPEVSPGVGLVRGTETAALPVQGGWLETVSLAELLI